MEKIYILIPAYNPDEKFIELIDELINNNFPSENIVVVNDGSFNGFDFSALPVKVLSHSINLGKGEALKNGFNYIINNCPNCSGVVTADCDMQHLPVDILKVADSLRRNPNKLILGSRVFKGMDIPLKSITGNTFISLLMKIFYKIDLKDTQTGLRGIPKDFAKHLVKLKTSDFSFETLMLILAKKHGVEIEEVEIETVYIDNNSGTNFKPLKDSYRVIKSLVRGVE